MDKSADDWLDLADAIELLRDQIMEAQRRGKGTQVRFAMGEITVELQVELARTRGAGGGLRFGVAGVDVSGERVSRSSHRVAVTLRPRLAGGGDIEVNDEDG